MTVAIVPAAGSSSRMGRPKLLLPFGDTTVAGSLLRGLRTAGVDRIVAVIAAGDGELHAALASVAAADAIEIAENPLPERGMLSSIQCGLEALGGAEALAAAGELVLVTPADLPAIEPQTIRRLVAALESSGRRLAVPSYRGKRGHPLAIAPEVLREVMTLDPGVGLRQLLDRHPVLELAVDDRGVVTDVDTPGDYARLGGDRSGSLA